MANTNTIAITIAIIGIDSIRPTEISIFVKSLPAISGWRAMPSKKCDVTIESPIAAPIAASPAMNGGLLLYYL